MENTFENRDKVYIYYLININIDNINSSKN